MDRQRKTTLLLGRESPDEALAQLRAYFQPQVQDARRPQPKTQQLAKQEVWRALLRLDRDKQWGDFLASFKDAAHLNQLVLLHGHKDQSVPLFVRRVEQHLIERENCLVVQVPLKLGTMTAKTGAHWGLHLRQAITSHIGTAEETPAELLSRATADAPLVIMLLALDNPLHLISTLSSEQQQGLQQFLESVLPAAVATCRRVTVLLPLEFGEEEHSILPWARRIAQSVWHLAPLCHTELDPLTLPSWNDVERYLRRYPEPLADLPALLATVKRLYDELCQQRITFERLAQEIDNAILLHG